MSAATRARERRMTATGREEGLVEATVRMGTVPRDGEVRWKGHAVPV